LRIVNVELAAEVVFFTLVEQLLIRIWVCFCASCLFVTVVKNHEKKRFRRLRDP